MVASTNSARAHAASTGMSGKMRRRGLKSDRTLAGMMPSGTRHSSSPCLSAQKMASRSSCDADHLHHHHLLILALMTSRQSLWKFSVAYVSNC